MSNARTYWWATAAHLCALVALIIEGEYVAAWFAFSAAWFSFDAGVRKSGLA